MEAVHAERSGALLRNAAVLVLAHLDPWLQDFPPWSAAEGAAVQSEAARHLSRHADAAVLLGPAAAQLVQGIALIPFLEAGGPFGPAWAGHPFISPAMRANYKLREPDITRALATLMGSGKRGAHRAVSFLRILTEQAGAVAVAETLTDQTRPTVIAEHPIAPPRRTSGQPRQSGVGRARIDLLFEWPVGLDGRRAVVVVEAKLGAVVSEGQLLAYREEARRRARGGPVALILLTAVPDVAERRYRAWRPVRWFALMRRWEVALADADDADAEFARVRAHLWRFILPNRSLAA